MNLEAECLKTASENPPFGHYLKKNRFEATQYLLLSGLLTDDDHSRNITKLVSCQWFNAKNLDGIF